MQTLLSPTDLVKLERINLVSGISPEVFEPEIIIELQKTERNQRKFISQKGPNQYQYILNAIKFSKKKETYTCYIKCAASASDKQKFWIIILFLST